MNDRISKVTVWGSTLILSAGVCLLDGCGGNSVAGAPDVSAVEPIALTGAHIQGKVHGGVLPIQGANIELWQTGVGAWNSTAQAYVPSFYNTTTNSNFIASTTSATQGDGSGLSPGYFTFGARTLTCTPGDFLYLTTTGGGTVVGQVNGSTIQVAVIGRCPASASQTSYFNNVNVYLSETSTVAAAYALHSFISIDTDPNTNLQRVNITAPTDNTATAGCSVSNGVMSCTAAGLANGFANAINLVDMVTFNGTVPSGAARASLPQNANAIAPQAMVNTLGNILQLCVDSGPSTTSAPSSNCSTLLSDAPTNRAGSAPTNTLQTVMNVAANPAFSNASTFFGLQTSNSPFTPMMSSAPAAFTLNILYPAAAIGDSTFASPADVVLDAQENVYVAYSHGSGTGAVAELTAAGTPVFSGATATGFTTPGTLAVDPSGYVWVTDDAATSTSTNAGDAFGFYTSLTSGTTAGTYYGVYSVPKGKASGIAFNAAGQAFITRDSKDANVNDLFYPSGSGGSVVSGTISGLSLLRAQVNAAGVFNAIGNTTFATFAALPCQSGSYVDSYATSSRVAGGSGLAIDNSSSNDTVFLPFNGILTTGSETPTTTGCWTATTTTLNSAGSSSNNSLPIAAALDGYGNLFYTGQNGHFYIYPAAASSETVAGGSLGGSYTNPNVCIMASGATACTYPTTKVEGVAIDGSGSIWYSVTAGPYLVQTLGIAQPAWPLLAYAKSGLPF